MTVVFDGTRLSGAESETDGGTWDKYKATQSPTQETDFVLQGTFEISNKVSNTTGGLEFEDDATVDFTTPKVVLAKVLCATPGLIDLTLAKGFAYEIGQGGNGGTWSYEYYLSGLYAGAYPVLKNWRVIAIDPNEVAWRDAVTGTVAIATTDWYGLYVDITAVVKSENLVHSALDHVNSGAGLTFTGTGGAFQDFLTTDFETLGNRWGVIIPGEAELVVNGVLTIGTATATTFADSNQIIVFPHHLVGEGFCGIDVGMSNASQDVDFTACTFKGLGNASTKIFFDTALDVDGVTEELDITAHPFSTGDMVLYSNEGGADNIGLTTATNYFVRSVTANSIALYAVGATVGRQNSFTDTTRVGLTAATAPGENHSLVRDPDTRPDHTVTGTTGIGVDWTSSVIDGCRALTLTSLGTITGGFITNIGSISPSTGTIDGVDISNPTTTEGAAVITVSTLANLTDNIFTASEGHAVDIDTEGAYAYSGNTHTGYGPNRAQFHTISDVNGTTEVITTKAAHGFTDGDAVYYSNHGGPDTVGLTNGNKYYVNSITTTTLSLHVTRTAATGDTSRVNLTAGTDGDVHSLYSGNAALLNSTAAALVSSYAPTNRDTSFALFAGAVTARAQSFTATAGVLSRVRFHLKKTGAPTGNAVAKLYAHSGVFGTSSVPTGAALATSKDFDVSTLETTNHALIDFEFDDRFSLVAATNYVISIEYSGGDVSNTVDVGSDNSTPTHGGNASQFTGTWSAQSARDLIFYVYRDGEVVVNIAGGGDVPTYRNSGSPPGVTIVNASVTVTFEAVDKDDAAIQSVQVSAYAVDDDSEIILQDTNASGIATTAYAGSTPRDIYYRYRKSSTGATKYVNLSGFATIASGTGVSVKRNMRVDDNADPSI